MAKKFNKRQVGKPPKIKEDVSGVSVNAGADKHSKELATWNVKTASFDNAHLDEKETLDNRAQSVRRDFPMVAGAVRKQRDQIVGPYYRLSCKPEWSVVDGMTAAKAEKFADAVDVLWDLDAESNQCWLDAKGQKTHTEILHQAWNVVSDQGELAATYEWDESGGPFKTRINMIDPKRIYNPVDKNMDNNELLVAGFLRNKWGKAYRAYIHDKIPGDNKLYWLDNNKNKVKDYRSVARWTNQGRAQWIHVFDDEYPACTRGKNLLSPALKKIRMLNRYEDATLSAAILHSIYAATITSSDPARAAVALNGDVDSDMQDRINQMIEFYDGDGIQLNGTKIPHLMPGDALDFKRPEQPIETFADFESAMLRHVAMSLGVSYEELTGDMKNISYSSYRGSKLESRIGLESRRQHIINKFATSNATVWMEEQFSNNRLPINEIFGLSTSRQRLAFFRKYKPALAKFKWWGTPREHVDPVKGAVSARIELKDTQSLTLEQLVGERHNKSLKQHVADLAKQKRVLEAAGLTLEEAAASESTTSGRVDLAQRLENQLISNE